LPSRPDWAGRSEQHLAAGGFDHRGRPVSSASYSLSLKLNSMRSWRAVDVGLDRVR
jgi:hypothetical protein